MVVYPKVSIIIPVYNVEKYLRECLDSVVNQTLQDIEIICVNDGSIDSSQEILKEYSLRDHRIKLIQHAENESTSQTRKDGVMLASGEYIMFLDSDDTLELSACEELYALIKERNVEILHFGADAIQDKNMPDIQLENLRKFIAPYNGRLEKKDIFRACFNENKYRWSLWNKIYSASLCKNAYRYVKAGFYYADDLYAYFILAYFAQSYCGVPKKKYYNYNFGRGITGRNSISIDVFKKYCIQSYVWKEIKYFLIDQKSFEEYASIYNKIHQDLIDQCVYNWYECLQVRYCSEGFDLLVKYFGAVCVISLIAQKYFNQQDVVAKKILGARSLSTTKSAVKNIGVFYHRISIGGVERVLSLLIPIWVNMGYEVILFTDEPPFEDDYELPDSVKRIVLPSSLNMEPADFKNRAACFERALKENDVDIILYYAGSSGGLLYDMLLAKSSGIAFVISLNESFSAGIVSLDLYVTKKPYIFKLANLVMVSSHIDKKYWNIMGVKAEYLPSPLTFDLKKISCANLDNQNVVWVGRFDIGKQYLDAVKIFAEVLKQKPDAKLLMVGNDITMDATASIKEEISGFNLEDNVFLCGYSEDLSGYYLTSSIHLITSVYEASPIVIGESKSFGLPCVMYELPYLEILVDGKGYIAIEQGDIKGSANAIIKLLSDDNYRMKMGREARESIEEFSKFDVALGWQKVFSNVIFGHMEAGAHDGNYKELNIILNTMLFHYKKASEMHRNALAQVQQESINETLQISGLEFHVQRIHSGIGMQILRRYYRIVDKLLPPRTIVRRCYNLGLKGIGIILNEGWRKFGFKTKRYVIRKIFVTIRHNRVK